MFHTGNPTLPVMAGCSFPVIPLPRLDRGIVRGTSRGTMLVQVARTSRAMTRVS